MASLEVDHFQDLFLGYDPPSKEMPFVGAYFRKSPIHKEVHILTLVLSEGQELNMTPTPCPRRNRSIVSVSSWKGWNAGAVFPYVPNHASLWASLGSGWKVRTQDPEKLDEEVKSLVTAWRLLEKRREHRQFPLDLIPDPRTLTSCPTFQRLPRAGQEVEEYLVLSCFYLFTYFLNILIFLYGWPHVILYNRHLFIHYLLLL